MNYFRKKPGAEIDFILDKKTAYEVKQTASPVARRGLARIQRLAKLKQGFVVSQQYVNVGKSGIVLGPFL